jgi:hypothetical protein
MSPMPNTFITIVQDFEDENKLGAAVLDAPHQLLWSNSFKKSELSSNLKPLRDFINFAVYKRETLQIQVLVEFPLLFEKESVYTKIVRFLGDEGYCWFRLNINHQKEKDLFSFLPYHQLSGNNKLDFKLFWVEEVNELMHLQPQISKYYAKFLLEDCPSVECATVAATLIAKNKELYYYFSSNGLVHSSQDVVSFMRETIPGSIVFDTQWQDFYVISKTTETKLDEIEKIATKYAVAFKRHNNLGKRDALKFALLNVCKLWKIKLDCTSQREDDVNKLKQNFVSKGFNLNPRFLNNSSCDSVYDLEKELEIWIRNAVQVVLNQDNDQAVNSVSRQNDKS